MKRRWMVDAEGAERQCVCVCIHRRTLFLITTTMGTDRRMQLLEPPELGLKLRQPLPARRLLPPGWVAAQDPAEGVKRGLIQVMEGRHCFEHLTVEENLLTGAYTRRDGWGGIRADLEMVYDYFPRLKERRSSMSGYTSGGEQQMCAIGRALMSRPETVLLDEPSMGLAPQLVEEIFGIVKALNEKEGVSFLLAEQNTNVALRFAHYGYILESGRVVMDGPAAELRENPDVKEFYLGMSDEGRKSFRDTRSYRRRKRWLN